MADRYGFTSPFGRHGGGGKPWFTIGNMAFNTTMTVIAISVASMFVWAAEGRSHSFTSRFDLVTDNFPDGSVLEGEVWRLVTWPLVNAPGFWTVITLAIFYLLGSQLEALMGRRHYTIFLLMLTLVPAVIVTALDAITDDLLGATGGLDLVEFGVLVAFAAQWPMLRFWPGIPAAALVGVFVLLRMLQITGDRNEYEFAIFATLLATALIGFKSLGYATDQHWIPRVPLPASWRDGTSAPSGRSRPSRRRGRGRGHLTAVPPPSQSAADRRSEMEIDALLDQVAEKGLDSLSKEQRKRLEDHSKRLRKRRGQ